MQLEFSGKRHDFLFGDHGFASRSSVAGTPLRGGLRRQCAEPVVRCARVQRYTNLSKYVLTPSMRAQAMQALYRMNVTNATLFPDLDGLARATAYELELVRERLPDDSRDGSIAAPDESTPST